MSTSRPCTFDHIQVYVDTLSTLETYKTMESALKDLAGKAGFMFDSQDSFKEKIKLVQDARKSWQSIISGSEIEDLLPEDHESSNQNLVEQLLVALGWRIVAEGSQNGVKSFVVESKDPNGCRFIFSCKQPETNSPTKKPKLDSTQLLPYFDANKIDHFYKNQADRQGFAVLSFDLTNTSETFGKSLETAFEKYKKLHPNLLVDSKIHHLEGIKLFESYAYYACGTDKKAQAVADEGTILRFVERETKTRSFLPGFTPVSHEFDSTSVELRFDHWVSNVIDRESFLKTLGDVLDFSVKVDFNAGVVAAGKAKIESTVTGNNVAVDDLRGQVFLPINNALSSFGHVHLFLEQIGQGVQHIASNVDNLVSLMERVTLMRMITGRGFSTLKIPRMYYGCLDKQRHLQKTLSSLDSNPEISEIADVIYQTLQNENIVSSAGVVQLEATRASVKSILERLEVTERKENDVLKEKMDEVVEVILKSRYCNVYELAGDDFSEEEYLSIVRNQILLDKQGHDVLMQIFTSNVVQRKSGEEAPFLEFIQRKCSSKSKPRPGCGGFGIRNFLTLFLSIEVSKSMDDLAAHKQSKQKLVAAGEKGPQVAEHLQQLDKDIHRCSERVRLFTNQLEESNPILNQLSDLMTEEATVFDRLKLLSLKSDASVDEVESLEKRKMDLGSQKEQENKKLQDLSEKYERLFDAI